jgi:hypothetical protein
MCRNMRRKRKRPTGDVIAAKLPSDGIRMNPRLILPYPHFFLAVHQW